MANSDPVFPKKCGNFRKNSFDGFYLFLCYYSAKFHPKPTQKTLFEDSELCFFFFFLLSEK
jgi:hypothetical protein